MNTHFVQMVRVSGVQFPARFFQLVQSRYPSARFQAGPKPYTALVVIPDLTWDRAPGGDTDFFCGLSRSRIISDYSHARYSDWDREVRA